MEKLTKFPDSGWCKDFDEDILKYLNEKANKNILKECKTKGNCGFAWQNYAGTKYHDSSLNVWAVKSTSTKTKYSKEQLRKFVPTTSCIETKGSLWNLVGTMNDYKDLSLSAIGINESRLENNAIDYHRMSMDEYYKRNAEIRRMEEERSLQEMKLRDYQIQPMWIQDDRVSSFGMSLIAGLGKKKDRFTQQETILLKSKKKRRKLIFS